MFNHQESNPTFNTIFSDHKPRNIVEQQNLKRLRRKNAEIAAYQKAIQEAPVIQNHKVIQTCEAVYNNPKGNLVMSKGEFRTTIMDEFIVDLNQAQISLPKTSRELICKNINLLYDRVNIGKDRIEYDFITVFWKYAEKVVNREKVPYCAAFVNWFVTGKIDNDLFQQKTQENSN